jgi:Collagen triple helix repeat (20 copies)
MFTKLREPFGKAGLIVAIVALVAALTGGAIAAGGGPSAKTTASPSAKAKQGPRGKQGKTGPAGPAGPAGAVGPAGAPGAKGDTGLQGAAGKEGPQGKQGNQGVAGKDGETGFTETLPSGKTETGVWSVTIAPNASEPEVPISFPIPVAKAGGFTSTHFFTREQVEKEEFGTSGCKWQLEEPEARPEATQAGTLCVFTQDEELTEAGPAPVIHPIGEPAGAGFGPAGAYLRFTTSNSNATFQYALGAWAVTGS